MHAHFVGFLYGSRDFVKISLPGFLLGWGCSGDKFQGGTLQSLCLLPLPETFYDQWEGHLFSSFFAVSYFRRKLCFESCFHWVLFPLFGSTLGHGDWSEWYVEWRKLQERDPEGKEEEAKG